MKKPKQKNWVLTGFYKDNLRMLLALCVVIVICAMCRVGAATLVQPIMDIIQKSPIDGIAPLFPLVGISALLMLLFYTFRSAIETFCDYLGQKLSLRTRTGIMDYLAKVPYRTYESYETGEIQSILRNDVDSAGYLIECIFARMGLNGVLMLLTSGYMIYLNPWVGVAVTAVTILMGFINMLVLKRFKKYQSVVRQSIADLSSIVENSCKGMDTIKSYAAQDYILGFFGRQKKRYNKSMMSANKVDAMREVIYESMNYALTFATMIILGTVGMQNGMTLSEIVVFMTLMHDMMMPIMVILRYTRQVASSNVAWERVLKLMDESAYDDKSEDAVMPYEDIDELEIGGISYGYDDERQILDDFGIQLKKGNLHVLKGESGCGKTTFLKIMVGLYDAIGGKFAVNGTDADKMRLFRSQVFVSANSPLFTMSIYENITLGNTKITPQMCMELADELGVGEWIASLPDGLDTVVSENSKNVSGGQQQMINNMRALFADAQVVILDEPTSALDKEREARFAQVVERVKREKILLITSHREDVIGYGDMVYAM